MKYADWNKLSTDEQKQKHWRHHPRVRIATIFSILFAVVLAGVLLSVFQNKRMHVNRKPIDKEAFAIAKVFVKERLAQPATANFSKNKFEAQIDTAANTYNVSSSVSAQDIGGNIRTHNWRVNLSYKGGDWADKNSWKLLGIDMD